MTTTSSQRPNLRPTSRSVPTTSNPSAGAARSRRRGRRRCGPSPRGTRAPSATASSSPSTARRRPWPWWSRRDVDRVLDRGRVRRPVLVRRQRAKPTTVAAVARRRRRRGRRDRPRATPAAPRASGARGRTSPSTRDLEVVDRPDRLGVVDRREPQCQHGEERYVRWTLRLRSLRWAVEPRRRRWTLVAAASGGAR